MSVRHDVAGTDDPARALDPETAGEAPDPNDGAPRGADLWVTGDRGVGCVDPGGRTDDRRERIDSPDGIHDALRRQRLGQRRDDRGLLRELPQLGLAGEVEQHRADRPADGEPRRGAEHDAAGRVDHPKRRHDGERPPRRAAREPTEGLAEHSAERGAGERDQRDVRASVADHPRRHAGAEDRAHDEPCERQEPGHEPARKPADRREHDHEYRDPVRDVHVSSLPTAPAVASGKSPRRYNPRALGA